MAVTKEDAVKAYGDRKVRRLFSIEGHEAKERFVPADRIFQVLGTAANVENCFITWDGESFGVYEVSDK